MSLAPLPNNVESVRSWAWSQYAPYFDALAARQLTAETIEKWLKDWTELSSLLTELDNRLGVATTLNTADEEAEKALLKFASEIAEPRKAAEQILKDKLLASGLSTPTIQTSLQILRGQSAIFREANLARETELVELGNEFDKVAGAQTVEWQGKTLPLSMLSPLLEATDRRTREEAWRKKHDRILADRGSYNELWSKMYAIRQTIAKEAGTANFQDYMFARLGRLDYTPQDVSQFRETIRTVVVPAAQRIYSRRVEKLGLESMRPWDTEVGAYGDTALEPYKTEDELLTKSDRVFAQLDPQLQNWFNEMREENLMDLSGRPGKANGGYCTDFPTAKRPFIFMNASGTHGDVQTLLHEAGHCFHAYECFLRSNQLEANPPMEFCEVASMGMEMLAQPLLGEYYSASDAAKAQIEHLERCLLFWPFMAVVDGFQDWAYTHPDGGDPAACDAKWTELWRQFMAGINFNGLEEIEKTGWHRKLHIFQVPFYYVEYGLAQIGAFQVWANSRRDMSSAVSKYKQGLALGSTVGLPKLFQAVGGKFAFDASTMDILVRDAEQRLTELLGQLE